MKQIIIGTAGHIDHGKTSLIKTLTGINTDRLKEEKKRGITIELGFAYLDLTNNQRLGIIDVPGHEKFIKNMVAGATGIDLVILVIAADEGIMPQTREHLDICSLLGITHGLVALTKIDVVDKEWLSLITEDVHKYLQGTFLSEVPILPVSVVNGDGIQKLIKALNNIVQTLKEHRPISIWRLHVDRVFTMKGFGTVITGTGIGETIYIGQEITIYPKKITAKIRGLQIHNVEVRQAYNGQRIAINLQGIEKTTITRGDMVARSNSLKPSFLVDVKVVALKNMIRPLKHRMPIRFHAGTNEIIGYIILLDRDILKPGDNAYCQIYLKKKVTLLAGDHYVLRSYSPVTTIAGGIVLHPHPNWHKRYQPEIMKNLHILHVGPAQKKIAVHASLTGNTGVSINDLICLVNLPREKIKELISDMINKQQLICYDIENHKVISVSIQTNLIKQALKLLANFHQHEPLKIGMSREEFKQRLTIKLNSKLYNYIINKLIKDNQVTIEKDIIRLCNHEISLKKEEQIIKERIEETYHKAGFTPPQFKRFIENEKDKNKTKKILSILIDEKILIKIKEDLYYHHKALEELKTKLIEYLIIHKKINIAQFKNIVNISRKYLIPLLEYFDTTKTTIRVNNERSLRKQ